MSKKLKFKPVITRVKLNPEQAVLACGCWTGSVGTTAAKSGAITVCIANTRTNETRCKTSASASTS